MSKNFSQRHNFDKDDKTVSLYLNHLIANDIHFKIKIELKLQTSQFWFYSLKNAVVLPAAALLPATATAVASTATAVSFHATSFAAATFADATFLLPLLLPPLLSLLLLLLPLMSLMAQLLLLPVLTDTFPGCTAATAAPAVFSATTTTFAPATYAAATTMPMSMPMPMPMPQFLPLPLLTDAFTTFGHSQTWARTRGLS